MLPHTSLELSTESVLSRGICRLNGFRFRVGHQYEIYGHVRTNRRPAHTRNGSHSLKIHEKKVAWLNFQGTMVFL